MRPSPSAIGLAQVELTPGSRCLSVSWPSETFQIRRTPGLWSRKTWSPTMMGDPIASESPPTVHLIWPLRSPSPEGSIAVPFPPRPESVYRMPLAKAGDEASPAPLHHQIRFPSEGSKPCTPSGWTPMPEATMTTWVFPWLETSTGVEWAKLIFGSLVSHLSAPSDLLKATRRESLAFAMAQRKITESPKRIGLPPIVTSNEKGLISCLQASLPSISRAAITDEA